MNTELLLVISNALTGIAAFFVGKRRSDAETDNQVLRNLEQIVKLKFKISDIKKPKKMAEDEGLEGACWEGYEPIGMKEKHGKMVPNCVPIEAGKVKEGFPIPSPDSNEEEDKYISRCISSIVDEYGQEQASAICYSQWKNK